MELLAAGEPSATTVSLLLTAYGASTTGPVPAVRAEKAVDGVTWSNSGGDRIVDFGNMTCTDNCSGHGECHNGTCICEIQYEGDVCRSANRSYYLVFASVFFTMAFVCLVQLIMCIAAERRRMKMPSLLLACRVTTQKLLYFVVFLASLIRAAYFMPPGLEMGERSDERWTSSLMSAYYPLLLSGSSLVVCFWAEVFHLRDVHWEKPQFLSKSFLAFVAFNMISYSLLFAEFYAVRLVESTNPELKGFYSSVFNGCYAALLFIVLVFFLIYGVEVFFKVRGGFLSDEAGSFSAVSSRVLLNQRTSLEYEGLHGGPFGKSAKGNGKVIDMSQLHQSRVGLLSQAFMLSTVVVLLWSETLGNYWKSKVPLTSRNWHDLIFRVVEIGVALWFPCVLWNCMSPEQLWILNPKRIIKKTDRSLDEDSDVKERRRSDRSSSLLTEDESSLDLSSCGGYSDHAEGRFLQQRECYICRDIERTDMGPLISPCSCRGDISVVHHDCLKKWLVEQCCADNGAVSAGSSTLSSASASARAANISCAVCNSEYDLDVRSRLDWRAGFGRKHWLQTLTIVSCMCLSALLAWVVIRTYLDPGIRTLAASSAMLVQYICVRFLSQKTERAVRKSKAANITIRDRAVSSVNDDEDVIFDDASSSAARLRVATISDSVVSVSVSASSSSDSAVSMATASSMLDSRNDDSRSDASIISESMSL